jgi:hypothetical protein
MSINGPAPIILAMYVAAAKRRFGPGAVGKLRGTVQADILKEVQAQNEIIFPLDASLRFLTDMVEYTTRHMPRWYPISISGYHIAEAGATPVQQAAYTLSNGFTYVELFRDALFVARGPRSCRSFCSVRSRIVMGEQGRREVQRSRRREERGREARSRQPVAAPKSGVRLPNPRHPSVLLDFDPQLADHHSGGGHEDGGNSRGFHRNFAQGTIAEFYADGADAAAFQDILHLVQNVGADADGLLHAGRARSTR